MRFAIGAIAVFGSGVLGCAAHVEHEKVAIVSDNKIEWTVRSDRSARDLTALGALAFYEPPPQEIHRVVGAEEFEELPNGGDGWVWRFVFGHNAEEWQSVVLVIRDPSRPFYTELLSVSVKRDELEGLR